MRQLPHKLYGASALMVARVLASQPGVVSYLRRYPASRRIFHPILARPVSLMLSLRAGDLLIPKSLEIADRSY